MSNLAAAAGGQRARKSGIEAVVISACCIARRPIEAKLAWLPVADGARLTWTAEIEVATGDEWACVFVDAETGDALGSQSLVVEDSARSIADAIARLKRSRSALASFDPPDTSAYRVFPIPLESPTDGDRELVSGAPNPSASPFGWHDTEGAALKFDFPLDLDSRPAHSQPTFVTNLFYWNNIVHDVTHNYRFDEATGNFQVNNYGNGGLGNDDVRAEAQDGSDRNNANFGAPDRDFDLDAGVIAHEYGHGICNRLTGGPATAICLNNAGQMGESWSDWFGMTPTAWASGRRSTRPTCRSTRHPTHRWPTS